MLYVVGNKAGHVEQWHVGEKLKFLISNSVQDVTEIQADGDELN